MGAHGSRRFPAFCLYSSRFCSVSAAAGSTGESLYVHSSLCASIVCKTNTQLGAGGINVYAVLLRSAMSYTPLVRLVKSTASIAINESVPRILSPHLLRLGSRPTKQAFLRILSTTFAEDRLHLNIG